MAKQANQSKNLPTAILGVVLILAGVAGLAVQFSPLWATPEPPAPVWKIHSTSACSEEPVPFDSYEGYLPKSLVLRQNPMPIRAALQRAKLEISRGIVGARRVARSASHVAHHQARQMVLSLIRTAREAISGRAHEVPAQLEKVSLPEAEAPRDSGKRI